MEKISIVIPNLNDIENVKRLVDFLLTNAKNEIQEIIIVNAKDANDNCETLKLTEQVKVLKCNKNCRATQLNFGAKSAIANVLYFIHADCIPPKNFANSIFNALLKNDFGYFAYKFDSKNLLLKINAWFTKYKTLFTGGGDQSFFIDKNVFKAVNGFDEKLAICEDFDIYRRLKNAAYKYEIIQEKCTVSARKYKQNNYFKVAVVNAFVLFGFYRNWDAKYLKNVYKNWLN